MRQRRRRGLTSFGSRSTIPVVVSAGTLGIAVALLVGVYSEPKLIAFRFAIPLMALLVAGLLISVGFAVTTSERIRISNAENESALRRVQTILSDLQPSSSRRLRTYAPLEIRAVKEPDAQQVGIYLRDETVLAAGSTALLGPSGAGKSTLLIDLAIEGASNPQNSGKSAYPIYLSALSWAQENHINHWAQDQMAEQFGIRRQVTSNWLASGSAVLFVDDLDELKSADLRVAFLDKLYAWHERPDSGKIVFTLDSEDRSSLACAMQYGLERIAVINQVARDDLSIFLTELLRSSTLFGDAAESDFVDNQVLLVSRVLEQLDLNPTILDGLEWSSTSAAGSPAFDWITDRVELGKLAEIDQISGDGNYVEALGLYKQLASSSVAPLSAIAKLRAGLIEAGLGTPTAQTSFATALELFRDLNPRQLRVDAHKHLNLEEQLVVDALEGQRPQLGAELYAELRLPPAALSTTLRSLISKGLISTWTVGKHESSVYSLAVDRRTPAFGMDWTA